MEGGQNSAIIKVMTLQIALNAIMFAVYLIFWGAAFAILYHLVRFGVGTQPKRFAAVFLVGAVFLFAASVICFANFDVASFIL